MQKHVRELKRRLKKLGIKVVLIDSSSHCHHRFTIRRKDLTKTIVVANTPTNTEHCVQAAIREAKKCLSIA
jgi:hypothetical protein